MVICASDTSPRPRRFLRRGASWRLTDWRKEYPQAPLPPKPEPLDTVNDLMDLPMGKLYEKIIKSDDGCKLYGHIPLMASSSPYEIGALNAESFCERVLRCAGHVLT